jgi:hypothetical protein
MHDLPNAPAVRAIRRIELRLAEAAHGGTKAGRRRDDCLDRGATLVRRQRCRSLMTSDRKAKIFHVKDARV